MLAELRTERDNLAEAISVLERLAYGSGKRRGRPPAWMTLIKTQDSPAGNNNKKRGKRA